MRSHDFIFESGVLIEMLTSQLQANPALILTCGRIVHETSEGLDRVALISRWVHRYWGYNRAAGCWDPSSPLVPCTFLSGHQRNLSSTRNETLRFIRMKYCVPSDQIQ